MSISQNFPNTRPSLNLNFARSKTLDPRITFSRTSTGTYVDESGFIRDAVADEPRFDHDPETGECLGLLVEESRSNLLTYSNDYSASPGGWTLSTNGTRAQDIVGPDGVANSAWTITDNDNTDDLVQFYKSISITASSSTNYCISSFVKDVNGTGISPEFYTFFSGSSTKGSFIKYNFSTDTITPFASDGGGIQPTIYGRIFYPNGWVRIYFVVNDANSGSNTNLQYRIYPNGRGPNTTGAIGLYGSQIEIGTFPTSYIPRPDASTATRNTDTVTMTGDNFSDWYNPSEGTFYSQFKTLDTEDASSFLVSDNSADNYILNWIDGVGDLRFRVHVPGSHSFDEIATVSANQNNQSALAYAINNFAGVLNGGTILSDSDGTLPTGINRLDIGRYYSGIIVLNGTISQLTYYPVRLPNSTLQTLTK